jgi:hypothetical protein
VSDRTLVGSRCTVLREAMAIVMAALRWHQHQLQHRPYLANTVTGVALMAIGDRLAQAIESPGQHVQVPTAAEDTAGFAAPNPRGSQVVAWSTGNSWARTGILSSWSAIISPFWTWWYRMMSRRYPGNVPRWIAMTAALSIPFNAAFFSYSTVVEYALLAPESQRTVEAVSEGVRAKLETRLMPTVLTSLSVWVPINYINFSFVPLHNRNLVASAFACCWNVFLSLQQHRQSGSDDDTPAH